MANLNQIDCILMSHTKSSIFDNNKAKYNVYHMPTIRFMQCPIQMHDGRRDSNIYKKWRTMDYGTSHNQVQGYSYTLKVIGNQLMT